MTAETKSLTVAIDDVSILMAALNKQDVTFVSYDGEKLVGPAIVIDRISALDLPALRKSTLLAYAAMKRYNLETGGTTINGMEVATDRQSQQMLSAAFNMAQSNPDFTTMWKGPNGNFTQLNAEQIIGIAQAVGQFVASCFAAEAAVVSQINAGNYTTRAHVDAAMVV